MSLSIEDDPGREAVLANGVDAQRF